MQWGPHAVQDGVRQSWVDAQLLPDVMMMSDQEVLHTV
jgi:hypothetical protein